jgi:hypothetical protein
MRPDVQGKAGGCYQELQRPIRRILRDCGGFVEALGILCGSATLKPALWCSELRVSLLGDNAYWHPRRGHASALSANQAGALPH